MVAVPAYVVRTRNLDGSSIFDAPHRNLEFSYVLNGPGIATWTMPVRDPGVTMVNFAPWKREVVVRRNGVDVWGGFITDVTASTGAPEEVRVRAEGWFTKLHKRVISDTKTYNNQEQFNIVWDLINYTQTKSNGGIGITRDGAEVPSGITRDARFKYWERRIIGEVIEELASLSNGFDFEITPAKVWKVFYPRKGVASGLTFELGINVHNISMIIDGIDTATEVHGIGAGDRDRTCISVVTDATAQAAYLRLEEAIDFRDIKHFSTLTNKVQRYLNHHKSARLQPQLSVVTDTPTWGSYSVGDTATVVANYGFFNLNAVHRIIAIVPHITMAGEEVITVHFDEVLTP